MVSLILDVDENNTFYINNTFPDYNSEDLLASFK